MPPMGPPSTDPAVFATTVLSPENTDYPYEISVSPGSGIMVTLCSAEVGAFCQWGTPPSVVLTFKDMDQKILGTQSLKCDGCNATASVTVPVINTFGVDWKSVNFHAKYPTAAQVYFQTFTPAVATEQNKKATNGPVIAAIVVASVFALVLAIFIVYKISRRNKQDVGFRRDLEYKLVI